MTRRSGERPTGRRRPRRSSTSNSEGTPRSLSEEVEAQAQEELDSLPDHTPDQEEEEALAFAPKDKLAQGPGGEYEKEYRLLLLHRLLMRRIPLDQIATQLGVSTSTVIRYRQELYKRLRKEAKTLDINTFIGDTIGFYGEVSSMALRAASQNKAPLNIRLAALRTALGAKDRLTKFLGDAGVLEVLKYEPEKSEGKADLEKIVDMTNAILQADKEAGIDLDLPEGTVLDEEEDVHLF